MGNEQEWVYQGPWIPYQANPPRRTVKPVNTTDYREFTEAERQFWRDQLEQARPEIIDQSFKRIKYYFINEPEEALEKYITQLIDKAYLRGREDEDRNPRGKEKLG